MHAKLKSTVNVLMIQTHVGIYKFLSNSPILKNYETAIKDVKDNNKSVAGKATSAFHNVTYTSLRYCC